MLMDKNDNLWMIDFRGSYTDSWVEPEVCETVEGDDQGLQEILAALEAPDANTLAPSERRCADNQAWNNEEAQRGRMRFCHYRLENFPIFLSEEVLPVLLPHCLLAHGI